MSSPTETITITNYALDRFARLETTLATKGLKMTGDDGEVKDFGADVKYHYDSATQVLTLTVLHGPHLKNFDGFVKQLTAWVEAQA